MSPTIRVFNQTLKCYVKCVRLRNHQWSFVANIRQITEIFIVFVDFAISQVRQYNPSPSSAVLELPPAAEISDQPLRWIRTYAKMLHLTSLVTLLHNCLLIMLTISRLFAGSTVVWCLHTRARQFVAFVSVVSTTYGRVRWKRSPGAKPWCPPPSPRYVSRPSEKLLS